MSTIFNPALVAIAKDRVQHASKQAFVDPAMAMGGGDPAAAGGGAPPPAGGAAPPPAGGDPAAAAGSGGGGGLTPEVVQQMIQSAMQQQGGGMGGGAGGAMGPNGMPKKKVDVNTEMYQIKKLLAMLADAMGVKVPATITMGDPADDPHVPPGEAAKDPHSAASQSAIAPPSPIQGASPAMAAAGGAGGGVGGMGGGMGGGKTAGYAGQAFDASGILNISNKAGALARVIRDARNHANV